MPTRAAQAGRRTSHRYLGFGGEGGIRTHEVFRLSAFQERRHQPLGHLSAVRISATRGQPGLACASSSTDRRGTMTGTVDTFLVQRMGADEGPFTIAELQQQARTERSGPRPWSSVGRLGHLVPGIGDPSVFRQGLARRRFCPCSSDGWASTASTSADAPRDPEADHAGWVWYLVLIDIILFAVGNRRGLAGQSARRPMAEDRVRVAALDQRDPSPTDAPIDAVGDPARAASRMPRRLRGRAPGPELATRPGRLA